MEQVIDFLNANPVGCLATVDDKGWPHVRPWRFMFAEGGKLWFCTTNTKEVFIQLQSHPAIEFCSTSKELITVRVSGEVIFAIDMQIKRKMLEEYGWLKYFYQTPDNPEFEIFYLKHGQAAIYDCYGQKIHKNTF